MKISNICIIGLFLSVVVMSLHISLQGRKIDSLNRQVKEISRIAINNADTLSDSVILKQRWMIYDFLKLVNMPIEEAHQRLNDIGLVDALGIEDDVVYLKGPGTARIEMSNKNDAFNFIIRGEEPDIIKVGEYLFSKVIYAESLAKAKTTPVLMCVSEVDKLLFTYDQKQGFVKVYQVKNLTRKKKQI